MVWQPKPKTENKQALHGTTARHRRHHRRQPTVSAKIGDQNCFFWDGDGHLSMLVSAASLCALADSCSGPHGKLKLLVPGEAGRWSSSELISTSSSKRLMSHPRLLVPSNSTAVTMLLELTQRQHEQCGDGGLLALGLSSALVHAAAQQQILPQVASEGFDLALRWVKEMVKEQQLGLESGAESEQQSVVLRLSWAETGHSLNLIRTALGSKPLLTNSQSSEDDLDYLANITLQACSIS